MTQNIHFADPVAARARLEEIVHKNLDATAAVVQRAMSEVPEDSIVRASALRFAAPEQDGRRVVRMTRGEGSLALHPHAMQQVASLAGVPAQYVDRLVGGQQWQADMLAGILNETFQHSGARQLVRAVGGQARAVLSDKFRRVDSRYIVDTFVGEVGKAGAVPYNAHSNDVRVSIKAIVPTVRELRTRAGSEFVAFGIEASNSDYGAGAFSVRSFLLRLVCLNGATTEDVMRQVHLGRRLADDLEFSQKTYELDTKATVSALRDVVRAQLTEARQEGLLQQISKADAEEVDWAKLKVRLSDKLTKDELRRVDESFTGPDVINLPAGNTAWRASNALSWLAHSVESGDRKLELERLAGGMMVGKVLTVDAK